MKFLRSLSQKDILGTVCVLRIDLNVIVKNPGDMYRLHAVVPTMRYILARGGRVVIVSHRGRPRGVDGKLSLKPYGKVIADILGMDVRFFPHFDFEKIRWEIAVSPEKVFLLENVRFLKGEEGNDAALGKMLASLGDFYVNDAFAVSHRKNASVAAITKYIPSYAGLCFEREVTSLSAVAKKTAHPFVIAVGGAKAADKMDIMRSFSKKADYFLLGGAPANTFIAASGLPVGKSLVDRGVLKDAKKMLGSEKVYIPEDFMVREKKILDIGPRTIATYVDIIRKAKMILVAGPVGLYHIKKFSRGTQALWEAIAKNKGASVVAGGGETIASIDLMPKKLRTGMKHVFLSTGGGAMIEFLSGKKLPGIQALK